MTIMQPEEAPACRPRRSTSLNSWLCLLLNLAGLLAAFTGRLKRRCLRSALVLRKPGGGGLQPRGSSGRSCAE